MLQGKFCCIRGVGFPLYIVSSIPEGHKKVFKLLKKFAETVFVSLEWS